MLFWNFYIKMYLLVFFVKLVIKVFKYFYLIKFNQKFQFLFVHVVFLVQKLLGLNF